MRISTRLSRFNKTFKVQHGLQVSTRLFKCQHCLQVSTRLSSVNTAFKLHHRPTTLAPSTEVLHMPLLSAVMNVASTASPSSRAGRILPRHVRGCHITQVSARSRARQTTGTRAKAWCLLIHADASLSLALGRILPRQRVPCNSRDEGSKSVSMTWPAVGPADWARHVIGCRLTQETRVQRACR